MPTKVGILCVPVMDDIALEIVRGCLQQRLTSALIMQESCVPNQRHWLVEILQRWCDEIELDLIITIGGTMPAPGPANAELVPEATQAILERNLPGLAEEMRAAAREQSGLALLDRSIAGIRGRTLILNLPAGAGAALFFLETVVELIEPLLAHLQERPDAPSLTDVFPLTGSEDGAEMNLTHSFQPNVKASKLRSDEFSAFLKRSK